MKGYDKLRKQLSKKYKKLNNIEYDWDEEITITAGATQAIYSAITAFVAKDDEVIIIEPAFDTYAPSVHFNGRIVKYSQTYPPDFRINWEKVGSLISTNTKMIILNYPNNPTGKNISPEDLDTLYRLINNTDILVMSDEVYEHILFDDHHHLSPATHEGLKIRSIIISSFGKTFHLTGWKLGYCMAPQKITHEFRKSHQNIVFAANRPMQMALADFLEESEDYLNLHSFYQKKRDFFNELMANSRFRITLSEGTFYQLADYSAISGKPDTEFAKELTAERGVPAIPLSAFYPKGINHYYVRFCFAKNNETLEKAAEKLCKL